MYEGAAQALDGLASVEAEIVIPGHGAPFADLPGALHRARRRLEALAADPQKVRRAAIRSTAAFWRLANPDAPDRAIRDRIARLVQGIGPLPDDRNPEPDAALVDRIAADLQLAPRATPRG